MNKLGWVIGGALLLAGCGSQDTRVPVALGSLVVPASAPWLQVEQQPQDVQVRGLDDTLTLTPTPPVSAVVQARLRHALQPLYYTDLVVDCTQPSAEMLANTDDTPHTVTLMLATHCTINARGLVSAHDYRAQPALPVPADGNYAKVLTALLATGADDIATHLRADIPGGTGG